MVRTNAWSYEPREYFSVTYQYISVLIPVAIVYWLLQAIWGEHQVLSFADLNKQEFSVASLGTVWFIFAWAFVATLVLMLIYGLPKSPYSRSSRFTLGLWLSVHAGVFEELIYRWLTFFSAMITLPFLNLITFGLVKWLYTAVLVPLANLVTLGALQPYLLSETTSWVLGAAIVTAAGAFRKAHEYLGYFGMVNAWFIGMVFFYLALNYGLITAIVAHILYDVIIFTLRALLSEPGSPYRFARFAD